MSEFNVFDLLPFVSGFLIGASLFSSNWSFPKLSANQWRVVGMVSAMVFLSALPIVSHMAILRWEKYEDGIFFSSVVICCCLLVVCFGCLVALVENLK